VTAAWGQYKREVREDRIEERSGKPTRVWQRYTRGGTIEVPLKDGAVKTTAPDPEFPDIYVQGQIRHRDTHFVVTLFLVNAQEEGRPKDEYHIFQPQLIVQGIDNSPIFVKRLTVSPSDDDCLFLADAEIRSGRSVTQPDAHDVRDRRPGRSAQHVGDRDGPG